MQAMLLKVEPNRFTSLRFLSKHTLTYLLTLPSQQGQPDFLENVEFLHLCKPKTKV
jgi:hypothetical protein